MLNILAFVVFSLISYSNGLLDFNHRCLLFIDHCVDHCPRMMHPYNTRCDGDTVSQRTCTDSEVRVLGFTCGWSRCDCNGDLVLDEETRLCVPIQDCSLPYNLKYGPRGASERGKVRMKNRVKIPSKGIDNDKTDLDK